MCTKSWHRTNLDKEPAYIATSVTSIHAFRWEGDHWKKMMCHFKEELQSTPSVGKATASGWSFFRVPITSIHAFRWEGDVEIRVYICFNFYFNPRLPLGRRLAKRMKHHIYIKLQSTPSVGKATRKIATESHKFQTSIHAFRWEGDRTTTLIQLSLQNFNPRLPLGRRLTDTANTTFLQKLQSTPSVGKATAIFFYK